MRIKIIGDIHGEVEWNNYSNFDDCDLIVFMGDYVDSKSINRFRIIENLNNIIKFKKNNMDKVILLLGNHDNQYLYLYDTSYRCSGFDIVIAQQLHETFNLNKHLFQNAFQSNNWLFTHAGIRDNWFKNKFKGDINKNIAEQLNNPKDKINILNYCSYHRGGDKQESGIFWCDKQELNKPLKNFNQIVGHNMVENIKIYNNHKYNTVIYFVDCLLNYEKPIIINTLTDLML